MAAGGYFENFKWPYLLNGLSYSLYAAHIHRPNFALRLYDATVDTYDRRLDAYFAMEGN